MLPLWLISLPYNLHPAMETFLFVCDRLIWWTGAITLSLAALTGLLWFAAWITEPYFERRHTANIRRLQQEKNIIIDHEPESPSKS